jgi:hypothetical protein
MKPHYLAIALLVLTFFVVAPLLKNALTGKDTRIDISDNKNELTILSSFPKTNSKKVNDYLRSKLNLTDLSDLNYLEIMIYQTPDKLMTFHIKSRADYLKILLDKNKNSFEAYKKMKEMGEGLKEVLTNQ